SNSYLRREGINTGAGMGDSQGDDQRIKKLFSLQDGRPGLMQNEMQGPQPNENKNAPAATRWIANATLASLPVLACFLGGATQKWAEGIVITLLALYLLLRPPQFSLGPLTTVVLLFLFIQPTV